MLIFFDHYNTLDAEVVGVELDPYTRFGRVIAFYFALFVKVFRNIPQTYLVTLFKADTKLAKVVLRPTVIESEMLLIAPQVLFVSP